MSIKRDAPFIIAILLGIAAATYFGAPAKSDCSPGSGPVASLFMPCAKGIRPLP